MKEKQPFNGISIGWKLAAYFLVFVALTLLVVWIFQILFLDMFVENTKKKELEKTASELSVLLGDETLERTAMGYASERFMSISIYQISKGAASPIVDVNAWGDGKTLWLGQEQLFDFYQKASENDGVYETKIAFGGKEVEDGISFLPSGRDNYRDSKIPAKNIRLVRILLAEDNNGIQYLLFLDTPLLPLDATVATLKMQFVWIAAILLAMAALMAHFLYRKISKPLIRMNASAKQLAQGRYDVSFFEKKGYRETRELAKTLDFAASELSQLDRLQKELIANISHDLRTPLTMIRGYGEMMRDIPEENTPENMQLILDETERLSELVNDLLNISKLQAGAATPQMEVFDLTEALSEVMTRYDAFTKRQGYSIRWSTEGNTTVFADRKMILQVFCNLINNAINYTGDEKSVWVSQTVKDQRVRISFTDSGNGIPQDQVARIWDRYYRVDKVHRRATVGSGLGLSIVKEILDRHHAAYGVSSSPGCGSTFWFELPVLENTHDYKEGQH